MNRSESRSTSRFTKIAVTFSLVAAIATGWAAPASADALYWDNAASAGLWIDDGATMNWSATLGGVAGVYSDSVWVGGSDAHFERTAGVVTLSGTIALVNSIGFDVDGYTLGNVVDNGTITLTGAGGNITTGAGLNTINSIIGGGVGLTKLGAGTLALAGTNSYTGGLTIKAGTVSGTTSANAFGDSAGVITIGDSGGSADATLNGGLAGTFANPIAVAAGSSGNTLAITNSAACIFSGAVTLNNNLTLAPTLTNLLTLSGGITGSGNLIISGSGTTAAVTLSTNPVDIGGTITNQGTNTGTTTISADIGANVTGVVQNSATSPMTLSGVNTYTGPTSISAGTLTISSASTFTNTSQIALSGTGRLNVNVADQDLTKLATGGGVPAGSFLRYSQPQTAGGTGPGTVLGTVELSVTNVNPNYILDFGAGSTLKNLVTATYTSGITLSGDASIDSSSAVFTGTGMTISASTGDPKTLTLTGTNAGANTITGIISDGSGTVSVSKTGTGAWTLAGANTYTGGTIISGGTLKWTADNNLGNAAGGIIVNGDCTLTPSGMTTSRTLQLNNGAIAYIYSTANPFTMNGAVTGDGGLKMNNSGAGYATLNFNSTSNTFTGPVIIAAGNQQVGMTFNSLADSSSPITFSGGGSSKGPVFFRWGSGATSALVLNNRQIVFDGVTATTNQGPQIENANTNTAYTITINKDLSVINTAAGKGLTLTGGNAGNNTFAGKISDGSSAGFGITKAGAGKWSMGNANNTFTGAIAFSPTTSSSGTLAYASAAGTNPITFATTTGSATLSYTGAAPLTMSGLITASALTTGTITLDASGTTAAYTINYSNASSLTAVSTSTGARKIVLSGSNTGNNIFNGAIANNSGVGGTATLTKSGAGTWVLTGANAYSGATTISGGKLTIASTGTINSTSGVSIGAGEFTYNSATALSQPISFSGTGGTLSGTGAISTAVTVTTGNTLAPGASAGTITLGGGLAINDGGIFNWENSTANAIGSAGADWDLANVAGTTAISSTAGTGSKLKLQFTNASTNFTNSFWDTNHSWDFITGGVYGVNVFDASNISIFINGGAVGVGNTITDEGAFTTVVFGSNLQLVWTSAVVLGDTNNDKVVDAADFINMKKNFGSGAAPVQGGLSLLTSDMGPVPQGIPEPATLGLLAIGALAVIRRRRKS